MQERLRACPIIGRRDGSGRRLEERRDDGESRSGMLIHHRDCPRVADCLRVLDRNSPADNDRRRMFGSESRGQDIHRIFDGVQVQGKFYRK